MCVWCNKMKPSNYTKQIIGIIMIPSLLIHIYIRYPFWHLLTMFPWPLLGRIAQIPRLSRVVSSGLQPGDDRLWLCPWCQGTRCNFADHPLAFRRSSLWQPLTRFAGWGEKPDGATLPQVSGFFSVLLWLPCPSEFQMQKHDSFPPKHLNAIHAPCL